MAEARIIVTVLALLLAMFLAGVLGLRDRIGIAILVLLSLAWFTIDKLFEPRDVLFTVGPGHGLTVPDFVGILGLAVSLVLWLVRPSRRPALVLGDRDRVALRPAGVAGEDV